MELLAPEHVILESEAGSKRALITELAEKLASLDPDQIVETVMAREHLGSTGIGHGVALPHGRIPQLAHPVLALARHPQGVDFDAIDGLPVHIVVLLLVPDPPSEADRALLARLARMLQQPEVCRAVMAAQTAEEIAALFSEQALAKA